MSTEQHKFISIIDELCTGCRGCQMICSLINSTEFNPQKARIQFAKVDELGISIPLFGCNVVSCPKRDEDGTPPCVNLCPTGALLYDTLEELASKRRELVLKRKTQPVFKVLAPWKFPFPVQDKLEVE